jgi:hypothetical protein
MEEVLGRSTLLFNMKAEQAGAAANQILKMPASQLRSRNETRPDNKLEMMLPETL